MANACWLPASIFTQLEALPTCTGRFWSIVLLMPNCPRLFKPKDQSVPLVLMAKLNRFPAETVSQSVAVPTCVTLAVAELKMPFPSWPNCPLPHDQSVPLVFTANECTFPAETVAQSLAVPI